MMRARAVAALGVGTYVAGIGVALFLLVDAVLEFGPWVIASAGILLGVLAALVARSRPRELERVREPRIAMGSLVPLGVCVVAVAGMAVGWSPTVFWPALTATLLAFVGWTVTVRSAAALYANRMLDDGENRRLASLPDVATGRISPRLRKLNIGFGVLSSCFAIVALTQGEGVWVFYAVVALGPLAVGLESDRTVTITDHGLLLESRFRRTLLEWDDFGGYYLGEDLVLLRSERWRSDLPFDREDLDHRAVDIVDQYLLRSKSPAVPAGGLERGRDGGPEPAES